MLHHIPIYAFQSHSGYIAGTGDGIVTAGGKPAARKVVLLDVNTLSWLSSCISLPSGHFLFMNLDPSKEYLVMCRDHEKQYEPFCYDYVKPATDLTIAQQRALWQSWQSSSSP